MAFRKIQVDMWLDEGFSDMGVDEKLFYLYAITSPVGNMAGFYRLPIRQIVMDTGISQERVKAILETPSKLFKYDPHKELILIKNFLKHNKSNGKTQEKGVAAAVNGLAWSPLFVDFFYAIKRYDAEKVVKEVHSDLINYTYQQAKKCDTKEAIVTCGLLEPYITNT